VIKRLYPVVFICLFVICLVAAPLLLAQDSESSNSQPANIGGAWQISWQGRGSQQATVQIQQDGSKLSGTFQDSEGSPSQLTGIVAGNNVSFSVQVQGRPMTLAFTGTIDGDKMSGTFQSQGGSGGSGGRGGRGGRGGGQGNYSWSGVRQAGSGRQSEGVDQLAGECSRHNEFAIRLKHDTGNRCNSTRAEEAPRGNAGDLSK